MSVIAKFLSWFNWPRPSESAPTLQADPAGVACIRLDGTRLHSFCWDDVAEIQTFKLDCLTYDDIRLPFRFAVCWHEFSEDCHGFMEMAETMRQRFPSIAADWYFKVMQPPFATNQRELWKRGGN